MGQTIERKRKGTVEYESRKYQEMPYHFSLYKNWNFSQQFNTNCHPEIEIIYTLKGPESICIENDVYIADPGDLTVVNSGHIHTGIGKNWVHHAMILPNDFLMHLGISISSYSFIPHIRDRELGELFLDVIRQSDSAQSFHNEMVRVTAERFLLALLRGYATNRIKTFSNFTNASEFEITSKVLNYLNCNFDRDFSIDEISGSIGISSPYMCRCVKHITGVSIIDHLKTIRCRAVQHYLMHSEKPINEIAALCGFNGRSYFAKVYRQVMGTSPSEVNRSAHTESGS